MTNTCSPYITACFQHPRFKSYRYAYIHVGYNHTKMPQYSLPYMLKMNSMFKKKKKEKIKVISTKLRKM